MESAKLPLGRRPEPQFDRRPRLLYRWRFDHDLAELLDRVMKGVPDLMF